jgi:tetratricopeptide (TPR) repeat protein
MHRAFVYYAMSEESRKYHHGRMGRHATADRDSNDFQAALEASHHFLKAHMTDRATEAVTRGAERAVTHGAPGEAEKALSAILSATPEMPVGRLNLLLARALAAQGKYQPALNALAQWPEAGSCEADRATAALVRAEALHRGRLADDEAIREAAQQASRLTLKAASEVEQMLAMQISAEVAAESGNPKTLRELGVHARRIAETTANPETRSLAHLTRGYCFLVAKEWAEAATVFELCLSDMGRGLDLERRRATNALALAKHAIGDYSQASRHYADAAQLAERIGDAPGASSSWSNLAVIHDHRGSFTSAATVFRKALTYALTASGPRRLVEVLLNAAGLAMTVGYPESARDMIAVAEQLAIQSRHWRLLMLTKLVAADSCLALADPEAAWQLVEEVEHICRGRVYALDNIGRYERLRRHYSWQRYGLSHLRQLAADPPSQLRRESVEYQLEIRAFDEWVARVEGIESRHHPSALERCKEFGCYGLIGGLLAVGILPKDVPPKASDEAMDVHLRRIFPAAQVEDIPPQEAFADYRRCEEHRTG